MTQREQEILGILKKNPTISQQELADSLGITRSSVAVHITNLLKKGYLLGKGYIVKDNPYVCVIGGSNIDIQGFPKNKLIMRDSNIGQVKISLGGVGRNIAENLSRLGIETRLISAVGDDPYGHKILDEARAIGLDMSESLILKGEATSTYLSILDETSDMAVAISHMDSIDRMTSAYIHAKRQLIENAQLVILDTNLPFDVIETLVTTFRNTVFFLDTVSTAKAAKVKPLIGKFHTIKPNKLEAEILSGIKIRNDADMVKAAVILHALGVKRIFISLGADGVFVSDQGKSARYPAFSVKMVNATGAGDAFMAGLACAYIQGKDTEEASYTAMAAAAIALSHEDTINPTLSQETINKKLKEKKHV
ncbi:MAG: PfkB family carbohydrate kinase [Erysipelotrichaceae bacterium]